MPNDIPAETKMTKYGRIPTAILFAEKARERAYEAYQAAEKALEQTMVEFGHLLPDPK